MIWTATVSTDDGCSWDARPVQALQDGSLVVIVHVEGWDVEMVFDRSGRCNDFFGDMDELRRALASSTPSSPSP